MLQSGDVATSHRVPLDPEFVKSIRSVADIMQWYDDVFIEIAYQIMLRRPADIGGRFYYLKRLRDGRSRIAILDQLGKASEANPLWEQVGDLQVTIKHYHASRRPLAGLWRRWTDPDIGTRASFNRTRAVHNALGRTRQDVLLACEDLRASQKSLAQMVSRQGLTTNAAADPARPLPIMRNPRLRSVFDVREIDFHNNEKRVINALRI